MAGRDGVTELVPVPGGRTLVGSTGFYPEEAPVREVEVQPFALERHPVTNAQFSAFVDDTGYVTVAEQDLDPADYPGADPATLVPGGMVFVPTPGPVPLDRWDLWWRWLPGASWRSPYGPGSRIADRPHHPVVLVAFDDAAAYAAWAGRDLPTELELEHAARGGSRGTVYAWGDELRPAGRLMANTWQGRFPFHNTGALGWRGTSPVGTFPANGFGLLDTIGNVWEWTTTYFVDGAARDEAQLLGRPSAPSSGCCAPSRAAAERGDDGGDDRGDDRGDDQVHRLAQLSRAPGERHPRRVLKGGSHLCAPEYCLRYRPAARSPQSEESATTHTGFRCVDRSS